MFDFTPYLRGNLLDLSGLHLTELPAGIETLTDITRLNCSNNQLTSLNRLQDCPNLVEINCSQNQLKNLQKIRGLPNLVFLECWANQISSLEDLRDLPNLSDVDCQNNRIRSLVGLPDIIELNCSYNLLTTLEGLPERLRTFECSHNQLTGLEGVQYLRFLGRFLYSNNPIQHIPPHIQRFITVVRTTKYRFLQPVDTSVSRIDHQFISNLLSQFDHLSLKGLALRQSINRSPLDRAIRLRIFNHFDDETIHPLLLVNFEEVFSVVWHVIQSQDTEVYQRLSEVMTHSEYSCLTSRILRLIRPLQI